jgi:hypothetical protein
MYFLRSQMYFLPLHFSIYPGYATHLIIQLLKINTHMERLCRSLNWTPAKIAIAPSLFSSIRYGWSTVQALCTSPREPSQSVNPPADPLILSSPATPVAFPSRAPAQCPTCTPSSRGAAAGRPHGGADGGRCGSCASPPSSSGTGPCRTRASRSAPCARVSTRARAPVRVGEST